MTGIYLTAEEAGLAASWYRTHPNGGLFPPADDCLFERLDKASRQE